MWLNHGWTMAKLCRSACMWAGQRVLCLLQNLFKQSKLSLTLTLARGKRWGSFSDYNWDPWAPHIAVHASQNVPRHLKRLETVWAIEHSVVVNDAKIAVTATIDHKLQRCLSGGVWIRHTFRRSFTPALVRDIMQVGHSWKFSPSKVSCYRVIIKHQLPHYMSIPFQKVGDYCGDLTHTV